MGGWGGGGERKEKLGEKGKRIRDNERRVKKRSNLRKAEKGRKTK